MKTFKFSLVLRTRENTDVFISLDDNIYGIHSKRINILYMPNSTVQSRVFPWETKDMSCPVSLSRVLVATIANGLKPKFTNQAFALLFLIWL